jgi:hypothetical protein
VINGSGFTARAGGFHGTLGAGAAPATPFTLGGLPQPDAIKTKTRKTGWISLFVRDIIPNTLCSAVMLVHDEGFV